MLIPDTAVGKVEGVLQDINLDQDVTHQLVNILREGIDSLNAGDPGTVPGSSFGAGSSGQDLGLHTNLAHESVTQALLEMVQTLTHTEDSVTTYTNTQEYNDYSARLAMANVYETVNAIMPGTPFSEDMTDAIRRGEG